MREKMKEITNRPARNPAIDLIKLVAILGVVMIHNCGFDAPVLSIQWTSAVILRSLVSASVPLFFMCSGALMLNPKRELTLKRLFTRNLPRLVAAMLVWGILYMTYDLACAHNLTPATFLQGIKEVLVFKQKFHLYFLHIMIAVYLWLPVIRCFVCHATKRELQYALGLWFLLGVILPMLLCFWPFELLTDYPRQWRLNSVYSAIGYGLAGYYLTEYGMPPKRGLLLATLGFGIVLGGTIYLSARDGVLRPDYLEGKTIGMALLALGLFGWLSGRPEWGDHKAVRYLSGASFCVYLVHVFVLSLFHRLGIMPSPPYLLSIPLLTLANVGLSCLVYALLRRIPVVRDWLI